MNKIEQIFLILKCNYFFSALKERTHTWVLGESGTCSKSCGGGTKEKEIYCVNNTGKKVDNLNCPQNLKPETTLLCNLDKCGNIRLAFFL